MTTAEMISLAAEKVQVKFNLFLDTGKKGN